LLSLLIIAIIIVPPLLLYDGIKSYNSLEEIGDDYNPLLALIKLLTDSVPAKLCKHLFNYKLINKLARQVTNKISKQSPTNYQKWMESKKCAVRSVLRGSD